MSYKVVVDLHLKYALVADKNKGIRIYDYNLILNNQEAFVAVVKLFESAFCLVTTPDQGIFYAIDYFRGLFGFNVSELYTEGSHGAH